LESVEITPRDGNNFAAVPDEEFEIALGRPEKPSTDLISANVIR
jgi:hypothetical protein